MKSDLCLLHGDGSEKECHRQGVPPISEAASETSSCAPKRVLHALSGKTRAEGAADRGHSSGGARPGDGLTPVVWPRASSTKFASSIDDRLRRRSSSGAGVQRAAAAAAAAACHASSTGCAASLEHYLRRSAACAKLECAPVSRASLAGSTSSLEECLWRSTAGEKLARAPASSTGCAAFLENYLRSCGREVERGAVSRSSLTGSTSSFDDCLRGSTAGEKQERAPVPHASLAGSTTSSTSAIMLRASSAVGYTDSRPAVVRPEQRSLYPCEPAGLRSHASFTAACDGPPGPPHRGNGVCCGAGESLDSSDELTSDSDAPSAPASDASLSLPPAGSNRFTFPGGKAPGDRELQVDPVKYASHSVHPARSNQSFPDVKAPSDGELQVVPVEYASHSLHPAGSNQSFPDVKAPSDGELQVVPVDYASHSLHPAGSNRSFPGGKVPGDRELRSAPVDYASRAEPRQVASPAGEGAAAACGGSRVPRRAPRDEGGTVPPAANVRSPDGSTPAAALRNAAAACEFAREMIGRASLHVDPVRAGRVYSASFQPGDPFPPAGLAGAPATPEGSVQTLVCRGSPQHNASQDSACAQLLRSHGENSAAGDQRDTDATQEGIARQVFSRGGHAVSQGSGTNSTTDVQRDTAFPQEGMPCHVSPVGDHTVSRGPGAQLDSPGKGSTSATYGDAAAAQEGFARETACRTSLPGDRTVSQDLACRAQPPVSPGPAIAGGASATCKEFTRAGLVVADGTSQDGPTNPDAPVPKVRHCADHEEEEVKGRRVTPFDETCEKNELGRNAAASRCSANLSTPPSHLRPTGTVRPRCHSAASPNNRGTCTHPQPSQSPNPRRHAATLGAASPRRPAKMPANRHWVSPPPAQLPGRRPAVSDAPAAPSSLTRPIGHLKTRGYSAALSSKGDTQPYPRPSHSTAVGETAFSPNRHPVSIPHKRRSTPRTGETQPPTQQEAGELAAPLDFDETFKQGEAVGRGSTANLSRNTKSKTELPPSLTQPIGHLKTRCLPAAFSSKGDTQPHPRSSHSTAVGTANVSCNTKSKPELPPSLTKPIGHLKTRCHPAAFSSKGVTQPHQQPSHDTSAEETASPNRHPVSSSHERRSSPTCETRPPTRQEVGELVAPLCDDDETFIQEAVVSRGSTANLSCGTKAKTELPPSLTRPIGNFKTRGQSAAVVSSNEDTGCRYHSLNEQKSAAKLGTASPCRSAVEKTLTNRHSVSSSQVQLCSHPAGQRHPAEVSVSAPLQQKPPTRLHPASPRAQQCSHRTYQQHPAVSSNTAPTSKQPATKDHPAVPLHVQPCSHPAAQPAAVRATSPSQPTSGNAPAKRYPTASPHVHPRSHPAAVGKTTPAREEAPGSATPQRHPVVRKVSSPSQQASEKTGTNPRPSAVERFAVSVADALGVLPCEREVAGLIRRTGGEGAVTCLVVTGPHRWFVAARNGGLVEKIAVSVFDDVRSVAVTAARVTEHTASDCLSHRDCTRDLKSGAVAGMLASTRCESPAELLSTVQGLQAQTTRADPVVRSAEKQAPNRQPMGLRKRSNCARSTAGCNDSGGSAGSGDAPLSAARGPRTQADEHSDEQALACTEQVHVLRGPPNWVSCTPPGCPADECRDGHVVITLEFGALGGKLMLVIVSDDVAHGQSAANLRECLARGASANSRASLLTALLRDLPLLSRRSPPLNLECLTLHTSAEE
ncbi:hypothetical protein DIPPA_14608 [Diplonema papillatum]|nr:hypothetical protein DIPPA_14608 [Diplonema papillatum]